MGRAAAANSANRRRSLYLFRVVGEIKMLIRHYFFLGVWVEKSADGSRAGLGQVMDWTQAAVCCKQSRQ
jgi:hypothetical protein